MRAETNQPDADYDPDAGGVGYLTWEEFDRFRRATENARTHVTWWKLAGHIKLGDPEEAKSRSSDPMMPLPATWLAAEEITNLLHELNSYSLEDAAKLVPEIAMMLTREVETAMAKWPMSDKPHRVRFLRCRACQQATLKYYPPVLRGPRGSQMTTVVVHDRGSFGSLELADVTVKCTNKECRAVEDPAMFEHDALLIEQEEKEKRGGNRRVGDGERGTGPRESIVADGVQVGT